MVKKSLIPSRMGELSYVHFYPFSSIGDYQRKRSPTGVFFVLSDSLKLKARSYHNGVPRHHPTENSLVAFPHWVTFVQITLQCVLLGSHQYQKFLPPPSISHLQWHPRYYSYDPIPISQVSFAAWSALLSYSEQRKFESTTLPLPLFNSFPPPPQSVGQSADGLTPFGYLSHASG